LKSRAGSLPSTSQDNQFYFVAHLFRIGRIFYGLAITEAGLHTIYFREFPYMFFPPAPFGISGPVAITILLGILLVLAGICIVIDKRTRQASLLLGGSLLLLFSLCYIPYELLAGTSLLDWDNAGKELALASGALVIADRHSVNKKNSINSLLEKLIPAGTALFCFTMITFGLLHFLYATSVADYVPSWVPQPLFWTYLGGAGLAGSGIAIILKIKPQLAAILLGAMIFSWFILLHIPRVMVAPAADLGSELTSAFLALAYCGIAFVIADRKTHRSV
jgi:uncharacterized membrane protein YphA (DoxX/SURF4 family)